MIASNVGLKITRIAIADTIFLTKLQKGRITEKVQLPGIVVGKLLIQKEYFKDSIVEIPLNLIKCAQSL